MADASSTAGKSATTSKSGKTGASVKGKVRCTAAGRRACLLPSFALGLLAVQEAGPGAALGRPAPDTSAAELWSAADELGCGPRLRHQGRAKATLTEHARNARLGRELLGHCVFVAVFCVVTIVPVDDPNIENFTYSMRSLFLQEDNLLFNSNASFTGHSCLSCLSCTRAFRP
jgi:hypothetical protein